jgi:hypothetical protein
MGFKQRERKRKRKAAQSHSALQVVVAHLVANGVRFGIGGRRGLDNAAPPGASLTGLGERRVSARSP